jgi:hypothetical protein
MQQLEEYGVAPLTNEEQNAVNGGDGVAETIATGAGAIAGSVWWLMRAAGSELGFAYMHL